MCRLLLPSSVVERHPMREVVRLWVRNRANMIKRIAKSKHGIDSTSLQSPFGRGECGVAHFPSNLLERFAQGIQAPVAMYSMQLWAAGEAERLP